MRETIEFAAALRLPGSSREERDTKVKECIEALDLVAKADILVGGKEKGKILSGGERRRVYVGRELVLLLNVPDAVLLLDEPTTGLDAAASRQLVARLCSLAHNIGCTVVMSVHSPRYSTFSLFHYVTIIDEGYIVYCGYPKSLKYFLRDVGLVCPEDENIADFVIDVLNDKQLQFSDLEDGSLRVRSKNSSKNSSAKIKSSGKNNDKENGGSICNGSLSMQIPSFDGTVAEAMHKEYCTKLQFTIPSSRKGQTESLIYRDTPSYGNDHSSLRIRVLCKRYCINMIRRPTSFQTILASRTIMGCLMAIVYRNQPQNVAGLQNISGFFFFSCVNQIFSTSAETLLSLSDEVDAFREEVPQHYYSVGDFLACKMAMQALPLHLPPTVVYSVITYWAIGLRKGGQHFLFFVFALFMVNLTGFCFVNGFAILFKNARMATILTPLAMSFMVLFSGIFVRTSGLFDFLQWLRFLSIFWLG